MIKVKKYLKYEEQKDRHRTKSLDGMASKLLRDAGFRYTAVGSKYGIGKK